MDKLQRWVDHTLSDVRIRAKHKQLNFDLTKEAYHQMYKDQNGLCAYCNVPFDLNNSKHARRTSPTTDRLIPEEGYVQRNVVLCCHRCNTVKSDTTPQELQTIATAVSRLFEQRCLPQ